MSGHRVVVGHVIPDGPDAVVVWCERCDVRVRITEAEFQREPALGVEDRTLLCLVRLEDAHDPQTK